MLRGAGAMATQFGHFPLTGAGRNALRKPGVPGAHRGGKTPWQSGPPPAGWTPSCGAAGGFLYSDVGRLAQGATPLHAR